MTEITEETKKKEKAKIAPAIIVVISLAVIIAAAAGIYASVALSVPDYAKEAKEAFGMMFPELKSALGDIIEIDSSENVSESADLSISADAAGLMNDIVFSISGGRIGKDSEKKIELKSGKAEFGLRITEDMTNGKVRAALKMTSGGNSSYFRRSENNQYYFLISGATEKLDASSINPEKNDKSPISPEVYGILRAAMENLERKYAEIQNGGETEENADSRKELIGLIADNLSKTAKTDFRRDFSSGIVPDRIIIVTVDGECLTKLGGLISEKASELTGLDAAYYLEIAGIIERIAETQPVLSVSITDRRGRIVSFSFKAGFEVPDLPDVAGEMFSKVNADVRRRAEAVLNFSIEYGENWIYGAGKDPVSACRFIADYNFGYEENEEGDDPEKGRIILTVSRGADKAVYDIFEEKPEDNQAKIRIEAGTTDGGLSFEVTDQNGVKLIAGEGKYRTRTGDNGERTAEFSIDKCVVKVSRKTYQKSAGGKTERLEDLTLEKLLTYTIKNRDAVLTPSSTNAKFLFALTDEEVNQLFGEEYYPTALAEFAAEMSRQSDKEMISADGFYLSPPESFRSTGEKYAKKYAEALTDYQALLGFVDGTACLIRCYDEGTGVWYVLTYDQSLKQALAYIYVDMTPDLIDITRTGSLEDGLFVMDDDITRGRMIPELAMRIDSFGNAVSQTGTNAEKLLKAVDGAKTIKLKSVKDYGTPAIVGRPAYDKKNGTVALPVGIGVYVYRADGKYIGMISSENDEAALNAVAAGDGCFIVAPEHGNALLIYDSATLKKTGKIDIPRQHRMEEIIRDGDMLFVRCEYYLLSVDLRTGSATATEEYDSTTGMALDRKNHRLAVTTLKTYTDNEKKGLYVSYYDTVTGKRVSEQDQVLRAQSGMSNYAVSFNNRAFVLTGPGMLTIGEFTEDGIRRAAEIGGFSGLPYGYKVAYEIDTGSDDIRAAVLDGPGTAVSTLIVRNGGTPVVIEGRFDYICPCGDGRVVVSSSYNQHYLAIIDLGK
ncbi:MAG: hypothetical protein J5830_01620 [Clostridia bacterium]|nr:hypothetical protein [Clostridia bacterium]